MLFGAHVHKNKICRVDYSTRAFGICSGCAFYKADMIIWQERVRTKWMVPYEQIMSCLWKKVSGIYDPKSFRFDLKLFLMVLVK